MTRCRAWSFATAELRCRRLVNRAIGCASGREGTKGEVTRVGRKPQRWRAGPGDRRVRTALPAVLIMILAGIIQFGLTFNYLDQPQP